jgi:hypothetical protein
LGRAIPVGDRILRFRPIDASDLEYPCFDSSYRCARYYAVAAALNPRRSLPRLFTPQRSVCFPHHHCRQTCSLISSSSLMKYNHVCTVFPTHRRCGSRPRQGKSCFRAATYLQTKNRRFLGGCNSQLTLRIAKNGPILYCEHATVAWRERIGMWNFCMALHTKKWQPSPAPSFQIQISHRFRHNTF